LLYINDGDMGSCVALQVVYVVHV